MSLSKQEFLMYRNLKTVLSEPLVNDAIVTYAKIQYDIALKNLLNSTTPQDDGKWKQAVMIYEHLINFKANVDRVLLNAKS